MNKAETKALIRLINRLDVIALKQHQEDVAAIHLIGRPEDVIALSDYLAQRSREPYLPSR